MISCKSCKANISPEAASCPQCGHPTKSAKSNATYQTVGGLVLAGLAIWYFNGGGLEHQAAADMTNIENQVATDAINQYNIAKRQGDKTQICVQAGLVSASFLQAKDEPNYQKWKKIESDDCGSVGIPE